MRTPLLACAFAGFGKLPPMRLALELVRRYAPVRPLRGFGTLHHFFEGKSGLEIGGPSHIFADGSLLPVYRLAGSLDNCNFSTSTTWQTDVQEGRCFKYHRTKPPGYQFISESTDLTEIRDEAYDFVLASHVIEHVANPLKALLEWRRVLRIGGVMLIVCPHKEKTFDHRRPVTSLSHLVDDHRQAVDDRDLTHLPEILELHDLSLDPGVDSYEHFKARSESNFENRCLHHHVFVTESWINIFDYMDMQVILLRAARPFHIVAISKKVEQEGPVLSSAHASNRRLLSIDADWRRLSPFRLDKLGVVPDRQNDSHR